MYVNVCFPPQTLLSSISQPNTPQPQKVQHIEWCADFDVVSSALWLMRCLQRNVNERHLVEEHRADVCSACNLVLSSRDYPRIASANAGIALVQVGVLGARRAGVVEVIGLTRVTNSFFSVVRAGAGYGGVFTAE